MSSAILKTPLGEAHCQDETIHSSSSPTPPLVEALERMDEFKARCGEYLLYVEL